VSPCHRVTVPEFSQQKLGMESAWILLAIDTLARVRGTRGVAYFSSFNNISQTCRAARGMVKDIRYRQAVALIKALYPEPNFEGGYEADLTKLKPHIQPSHYTDLFDLLSGVSARRNENYYGWPVLRISYLLHASPVGAIVPRDISKWLLDSLFPLFMDRDESEASAYIAMFFDDTGILKLVAEGFDAFDWLIRVETFAYRSNEKVKEQRREFERSRESKRRRVAMD
jgi:hypothetical protein